MQKRKRGKKKKMKQKPIIFALILLMIPLLAISAYAVESTVTRSFSDNTPNQCSELTVSLTVDVNDVDRYYAIDEEFPSGWVISDPGTGDTSEAGHIKWVVIQNAVDTVYQYNVTVPCNVSGIYNFNGSYMFENDAEEQIILGETDVDVQLGCLDEDGDGYGVCPNCGIANGCTYDGDDCDDSNENVNPGATEICDDEIDNDCDGLIDTLDPDCIIEESTVTRSFSDNTPEACSELTVSLDVDVNDVDTYYAIDEEVPPSWVISDPGTGDTTEAGHIKWVVIMDPVDTVYQYNVDVPCDVLGIYSFNGTYMFENDTVEQIILGEKEVDVQQIIELYEGWNLVSLPIQVTDNTLPNVLASIAGNYDKVVAYNPTWKMYDPSDIPHSNLASIEDTMGVWIKMTSADKLELDGSLFNTVNFNLKTGYNLISYPSLDENSASYVFGDVIGDVENVLTYENGEWKSYDPNKASELNTLTVIKPGQGYWVKVDSDVSWSFDGKFS